MSQSEIEFVKEQLQNFNVVQVLASTTDKKLKFNCNTSTNVVRYLVESKNKPFEIYTDIKSAIESYNSY